MENQYDLIVIGAGNGGLMADCRAAHAGLSVLVAERHHLPGEPQPVLSAEDSSLKHRCTKRSGSVRKETRPGSFSAGWGLKRTWFR